MNLEDKLRQVATSDDFESETREIVAELESSGGTIADVSVILAFMEKHPMLEFGAPGPLVHWVETLHRRGYEEALFTSVTQQPTPHTMWMLNRLLNGTTDDVQRTRIIEKFREALAHPLASELTKEEAAGYLRDLDPVRL